VVESRQTVTVDDWEGSLVVNDRLLRHYRDTYAPAHTPTTTIPILPLRSPRPRDRFEAALSFLPDRIGRGADVLELGAGDGRVAHSFAHGDVPFRSYTIGDISPPRMATLRTQLDDPRFQIVELDAEEVDGLPPEQFDVVVMIALIEHLVDPLGAMTSLHRLLRPGGFIYLDTPNIAKWTRRLKLLAGHFPSTASRNEGLTTYAGGPVGLHDEGHLHYFTYRSLTTMLLARCGYAHAEHLGYSASPRPTRLGTAAAKALPTVFSEIALVAHV
jgi:SAM-dependent methyltransferase